MTDHWDDDFDLPDEAGAHHEEVPLDPPEDHADLLHQEPELDDHPHEAVLDLAEPDAPEIAEHTDDFPPNLDVELPEPVDGFPWIDTATLGTVDPAGFTAPTEPVSADELAAYAGVDLTGDADPWTTLAASEDPATSALARWWTPDEQ